MSRESDQRILRALITGRKKCGLHACPKNDKGHCDNPIEKKKEDGAYCSTFNMRVMVDLMTDSAWTP